MSVEVTTREMTLEEAKEWIETRGITRLPRRGETLEYIPPGSYNQYDLTRDKKGFCLTSTILK